MIYAIPLVVSCFLALWFCYWITNVFSSLDNRPCRVACLTCPVLLAGFVITFQDLVLSPFGEFMEGSPLPLGRQTAILAISFAVLLIVSTLLITTLIGQVRILSHGKSGAN